MNFPYESLAYKALPIIMAMLLPSTDANGVVFTGAIPVAMFNPDWNLMQVTARGLTEPNGIVVDEVFGWGFNVILR